MHQPRLLDAARAMPSISSFDINTHGAGRLRGHKLQNAARACSKVKIAADRGWPDEIEDNALNLRFFDMQGADAVPFGSIGSK
jgi:hypothetical protein